MRVENDALQAKEITGMSETAAGVFVTVDMVIPRLSPSRAGWEAILIQQKKELLFARKI